MKITILIAMAVSLSTFAAPVAGSFTPTSVLVPIFSIGFTQANNSTDITAWQCPAQTVAGCTVDIADQTAMNSLFASGGSHVPAGTYAAMYANTCSPTDNSSGNGGYTLKVKGSVTINSVAYTTQSGTEPLSNSTTADYVSVKLTGCQQNIYFPGGITISDGQSVTVNLLTDLTNTVLGYYGASSSPTTNFPKNCVAGTQSALCVTYPALIPYSGTSSPTVAIYQLTTKSTDTTGAYAFGQFIEFLDASGNILGISTGAAAGASTPTSGDTQNNMNTPCPASGCNWAINPFASPIYKYTTNADGTLKLQAYGDNGGTDATTAGFTIDSFPLPAVGAVSTTTYTLTNPSAKIFSTPVQNLYSVRVK